MEGTIYHWILASRRDLVSEGLSFSQLKNHIYTRSIGRWQARPINKPLVCEKWPWTKTASTVTIWLSDSWGQPPRFLAGYGRDGDSGTPITRLDAHEAP